MVSKFEKDLMAIRNNGSKENSDNNLSKLEKDLAMIRGERPTQDPSFLQRGASALKAGAAGVGGMIPDTITSLYNIPNSIRNAGIENDLPIPSMTGEGPVDEISGLAYNLNPKETETQLPNIPSATHAIEEGIDTATGGYTKTPDDQKSFNEGIKLLSSIWGAGKASEVAQYVGKEGLAKLFGALGSTNPNTLVGAGVTGGVTSELQDQGYGLPASLAGGLVAGSATQGALGAAKSFGEFIKNPKEKISNLEERTRANLRGDPRSADLEAIDTAEKLGIETSLTHKDTSAKALHLEKTLEAYPGSGALEHNTKMRKDQLETINKNLDIPKEDIGALSVGRGIKEDLVKKRDAYLDDVSRIVGPGGTGKKDLPEAAYDIGTLAKKFEKENITHFRKINRENFNKLKKGEVLTDTQNSLPIIETLEEIKKEVGTHHLEGTTGSTLIRKIKELEDKFLETKEVANPTAKDLIRDPVTGNITVRSEKIPKEIPIKEFIDLRQDLNELIHHEDYRKLDVYLKKINDKTSKILEQYGHINKRFAKNYKEANSYYAKYINKDALGSKTMRDVFTENNPEKIIGLLNKTSDFREIEKSNVLGKKGTQFIQGIKDEKIKSLMSEIVDGKGKVFEDPVKVQLLKYLAGPEKFQKLRNLSMTLSSKEGLGSNLAQKIFKEEAPENILKQIDSISDFKNLENLISSDKNSVKNLKNTLLDTLVTKAMVANSGEIAYGGLGKILEDPKKRELIQHLLDKEKFGYLENAVKFGKQMLAVGNRNTNKSGTAFTMAVRRIKEIAAFIAGGAGFIHGGGLEAYGAGVLGGLAADKAVKELTKAILDPKTNQAYVRAAKALKAENMKGAENQANIFYKGLQKFIPDDSLKILLNVGRDEAFE